jgi:hypothetical protein
MIWTGDQLGAVRRLQKVIVGPARTITEQLRSDRIRFRKGVIAHRK